MTTLNYENIKWLIDSPYFVPIPHWHLKESAPEDLKKRFEKWQKEDLNLTQ